MIKTIEVLNKIYESNKSYIGNVLPENFASSEKFSKWMSTFLVRRVKKEFFNKNMKIEVLTEYFNDYDRFNTDLEYLEKHNLIAISYEYVVITELGLLVYFYYYDKGHEFLHLDDVIQLSLPILAEGITRLSKNKIVKLFPQGLAIKEVVFVIFLILNSANSEQTAFRIRELSDGFSPSISPLNKSFAFIYEKLFNGLPEDIIMQDSEFSNFMRRNTSNGNIGRVFGSVYISKYDKKSLTRFIYFNLFEGNIKNYEDSLYDLLVKVRDFCPNNIESQELLNNLRSLTVSYLIENKLLPHEQLIYFNSNNYRDLLYSLISVLDKFILSKE